MVKEQEALIKWLEAEMKEASKANREAIGVIFWSRYWGGYATAMEQVIKKLNDHSS